MPTLNFPVCYFAESRLILNCSSCIRPHWPQSRSPPSLRTCPALSQETSPRARTTSFLLPSMGRQGGGQCWLPGKPTGAHLLLPWRLITLHYLTWRRQHLLASMQNQSAAPSASGQKSLVWQVLSPLPSGNTAEKVGTERFCIKSSLNLYHLLRGSLSGL